jgi:hypothetical protein
LRNPPTKKTASWLLNPQTKDVLLVVKITYQKVVKLVVESFNQKSGLSVVEFID